MTVKSVEISFENCEVAVFSGDDVGFFSLENITKSIIGPNPKHVNMFNVAKETYIELAAKSNVPFSEENGNVSMETEIKRKLDRIHEFNDIVSIDVTFVHDGTGKEYKESVYVAWVGDDYSNKNQRSKFTKNGDLLIYVGEKEEIEMYSLFSHHKYVI